VGENEEYRDLIEAARAALGRSYTPYCHYEVGSAVLTEDGTVFAGCNVENASYSATICAERTALVKAISEGHTKFKAIAVVCAKAYECWPCGVCRQFICEFGLDVDVIVESADGSLKSVKFGELLPYHWDLPR